MAYETLLFEKRDGVARITLNRPKAYNALNGQMAHDLFDAVAECDADNAVRAVVLTGQGKAFCAGGDVASFHEAGDDAGKFIKKMVVPMHAAVSRLIRMNKPTLAAINGVVAGAGIGFLVSCDLAICVESATFNVAYTGIGASPDGSSTFFLPRILGVRRAMELALTNRVLTSREALDWGLINRVVPDAELEAETQKLAEKLARGPTLAYGATKRLLWQSFHNSPETQMEEEAQWIAAMASTADFREGVTAFVEKRKPGFQGK